MFEKLSCCGNSHSFLSYFKRHQPWLTLLFFFIFSFGYNAKIVYFWVYMLNMSVVMIFFGLSKLQQTCDPNVSLQKHAKIKFLLKEMPSGSLVESKIHTSWRYRIGEAAFVQPNQHPSLNAAMPLLHKHSKTKVIWWINKPECYN